MIHTIGKEIISNLQIDRFVETGTFVGETVSEVSGWLQDLDPDFGVVASRIESAYLKPFMINRPFTYPLFKNSRKNSRVQHFSVDVDEKKQKELQAVFKSNPNIHLVCESSEQFLKNEIDAGRFGDHTKCLFFLDAHWGEYWPLRDEIREILRLKRSVIVIDDFSIPFRPGPGFDIYKYRACCWFYVRDLFRNRSLHIYYPRKTQLSNRGSVFIFIGYAENELKFMDSLPCYRPIFNGEPFVPMLGIAREFFTLKIRHPLANILKDWGLLKRR